MTKRIPKKSCSNRAGLDNGIENSVFMAAYNSVNNSACDMAKLGLAVTEGRIQEAKKTLPKSLTDTSTLTTLTKRLAEGMIQELKQKDVTHNCKENDTLNSLHTLFCECLPQYQSEFSKSQKNK